MSRSWVKCPICDSPEMRKETLAEGMTLIFCSNHACRSNGGNYDQQLSDLQVTHDTLRGDWAFINKSFKAACDERDAMRAGTSFERRTELLRRLAYAMEHVTYKGDGGRHNALQDWVDLDQYDITAILKDVEAELGPLPTGSAEPKVDGSMAHPAWQCHCGEVMGRFTDLCSGCGRSYLSKKQSLVTDRSPLPEKFRGHYETCTLHLGYGVCNCKAIEQSAQGKES